jgi:DNA-binding CsgD family transcriptional regulator
MAVRALARVGSEEPRVDEDEDAGRASGVFPALGAIPDELRVTAVEVQGESYVLLSWPIEASLDEEPRLSPAEQEVARLLLEGRSNAEIAQVRGTNVGTVKKQVQGIYAKLGVGSRGELAARLASRALDW